MGWSGEAYPSGKTKKEFCEEIIESFSYGFNLIASKNVSEGMWTVVERKKDSESGGYKKGDRYITLHLMRKHQGCWAEKAVGEEMGPCHYSCPEKFFGMVECKGGYAAEFREKCRAMRAAKKARSKQTFEVGEKVEIYGKDYTILRPFKRSFIVRSHEDGREYKTGSRNINKVG
jgi:hypothetical protein